jgi:hypothetical protein
MNVMVNKGSPNLQMVTLVSKGGTPVTLADQYGAPFPTTGRGALVFADGATLSDVTLEGGFNITSLLTQDGNASVPAVSFTNDPDTGIFRSGDNSWSVSANGVQTLDVVPGGIVVHGDITYSGQQHGAYHDPLTNQGDLYYRNAVGSTRLQLGPPGTLLGSNGSDLVYVVPTTTITVGSTPVLGGAIGHVLYDNTGVVAEYAITGTAGSVVMSEGPTINNPTITGTPTIAGYLPLTGGSLSGDLTVATAGASSSVTINQPDAGGASRPALALQKQGVTEFQISGDPVSLGTTYYEAIGANALHAFYAGGVLIASIGPTGLSMRQPVLPGSDNAIDLGATASRWRTTYTVSVNAGASDLALRTTGTVRNVINGVDTVDVRANGLATPDDANVFALTAGRYSASNGNAVYNTSATATSVQNQINGVAVWGFNTAALYPTFDNAYALGTSTQRWLSVYTPNVRAGASDLSLFTGAAGTTIRSVINGFDVFDVSSVSVQSNIGSVRSSGNGSAAFALIDTSRPTDGKIWDIETDSSNLNIRAINDAYSNSSPAISIVRGSGFTVTGTKLYGRTTLGNTDWYNAAGSTRTAYVNAETGDIWANAGLAARALTADYRPAGVQTADIYPGTFWGNSNAGVGVQVLNDSTANGANVRYMLALNGAPGGTYAFWHLDYNGGTPQSGISTGPTVGKFFLGVPGTQVNLINGYFYPDADNATTLGGSGNRWTSVWAVNGAIQTSDVSLKTDIAPLPDVAPLFDDISPITFRFIEGGKTANVDGSTTSVPGKRTHWGFDAGQIRDAFGKLGRDFGGYVRSDDGLDNLRPDQLIPVLWKRVQELSTTIAEQSAEIAALKAPASS